MILPRRIALQVLAIGLCSTLPGCPLYLRAQVIVDTVHYELVHGETISIEVSTLGTKELKVETKIDDEFRTNALSEVSVQIGDPTIERDGADIDIQAGTRLAIRVQYEDQVIEGNVEFVVPPAALELEVVGDGTVMVENDPYDEGTRTVDVRSVAVTKLAVAPGSVANFMGWSGTCTDRIKTGVPTDASIDLVLNPNETVACKGEFRRDPSMVSLDVRLMADDGNPSAGTITAVTDPAFSPAEITCGAKGSQCSDRVSLDTPVQLVVESEENYDFVGWNAGCELNERAYSILTRDTICIAEFHRRPEACQDYNLTIGMTPVASGDRVVVPLYESFYLKVGAEPSFGPTTLSYSVEAAGMDPVFIPVPDVSGGRPVSISVGPLEVRGDYELRVTGTALCGASSASEFTISIHLEANG